MQHNPLQKTDLGTPQSRNSCLDPNEVNYQILSSHLSGPLLKSSVLSSSPGREREQTPLRASGAKETYGSAKLADDPILNVNLMRPGVTTFSQSLARTWEVFGTRGKSAVRQRLMKPLFGRFLPMYQLSWAVHAMEPHVRYLPYHGRKWKPLPVSHRGIWSGRWDTMLRCSLVVKTVANKLGDDQGTSRALVTLGWA